MHTKLSIRPQMNISPQLVMAGKLLQVAGSELGQLISSEVANNPALEMTNVIDSTQARGQLVKFGDQSTSCSSSFSKARLQHFEAFDEIVENIAQQPSAVQRLAEQVSVIVEKADHDIAIDLLHHLDHRGYLVMPTEELASELGVSNDMIVRGIRTLHQLEPPGIGARDLRECFLIQCTHLEAEGINCQHIRRILTLAWREFLNQQWERVARKIQEPKRIVEDACEFMRLNFYPYPLTILDTSIETDAVLNYADLIILRNNDLNQPTYTLQVPGAEDFELQISSSFQEMLGSEVQDECRLSAQEKTWLKLHLDRASIVIRALSQRWETLRQIGEYLIQHQSDFVENGPRYLKPLTRASVARELNVHESTVSRAVHDKIIQLPDGKLVSLSDFFDSSLAAKEAIRLLLRNNSKSMCDREIAERLQGKGIKLSRRTVTKYRRELNLHSSRQQSIAI